VLRLLRIRDASVTFRCLGPGSHTELQKFPRKCRPREPNEDILPSVTPGAHKDRCPACDTPLNSVTIDPYQKATAGLRDLLDLAVLQDEVADCREKTDDASRSLRANLDTLFSSMTLDEKNRTSVGRYIAALDQTPRSDRWWQDVYALIRIDGAEAEPASLEQVLAVASRIELRDQEIQRQIQERQTIVQEREQLLQWQRQILERELIRKSMSMRSPRRESASRVSMRKMRT
jgi:hypothetical protein